MRRLLSLLAFACLATPLFALSAQAADTKPLPADPPPPPAMAPVDDSAEPQVTIKQRENDTVEEYRVNGKLYMIKVIPTHGAPYFLVDEQGTGNFVRKESNDSGVRVPMWVIGTF